MRARVVVGVVVALLAMDGVGAVAQAAQPRRVDPRAAALHMADHLLAQQDANGAIVDEPGGDVVNEDSDMEYALFAIGAAYRSRHDPRYLDALERGIRWLAGRMETADPFWRGSFRYAYAPTPPYAPIAVSPGAGIVDARGVDASSSLFVALLDLDRRLTGSRVLADGLAPQARAALDFLFAHDRAPDGFFWSSWQQHSSGAWTLWKFQYSADQGDVYLGLRAGARTYGDARAAQAAAFLAANAPTRFFNPKAHRFALGRDSTGALDMTFEGFNGIFPQGYLAWVFGDSPSTHAAVAWLGTKVRADGSVRLSARGTAFSLSAAVLLLGGARTSTTVSSTVRNWLLTVPFDPLDGGVRDTAAPATAKYSNVAGFSALALLGAAP